jgi:hypothetical protein
VLPVAGLIAETGATLRQAQFDWLREIARLPETRRETLLRSVEAFRDADANPLGEEIREELLERLGMFGLRLSVALLVSGEVSTAGGLSSALLERSGIRELARVLSERYSARAQPLKARSALVGLRAIAETLDRRGLPGAGDVLLSIDRLEASSGELALLRLLHLVLSGTVELPPAERTEVDRLCSPGPSGVRVGLAEDAPADEVRALALAGVERWRSRAANPFSDRRTIEAAEIVSRAYEEVYAAAG